MKGLDRYDLICKVGRYPEVRISHLDPRMHQSGDCCGDELLALVSFQHLLWQAVDSLDVEQARRETGPFIVDGRAQGVWSRDFFRQITPAW